MKRKTDGQQFLIDNCLLLIFEHTRKYHVFMTVFLTPSKMGYLLDHPWLRGGRFFHLKAECLETWFPCALP